MEKELEKIKKDIFEFCNKYQCSMKIDTVISGRLSTEGTIIPSYITVIIEQ